MKKIFLLSAAVLLTTITTFAQGNDEEAEELKPFPYQNTFGLTGSTTSGSGVYYKAAVTQNFQAKLAGFIYFNESSDNNSSYYLGDNDFFIYNVGIELQRNLYTSRNTRFYALAGVNYMYDRNTYDNYYYSETSPTTEVQKNIYKTIRGGIGVGFEFVVWKHLSMNLDGSFNLYNTDTEFTDNNVTTTGYERGGHIGGGIGIGYTF